ncbi:hypothetical protein BU26DRAFT_297198 [Trematosphaeria pertusa]|uniref:Uncharacterized protein n=1 Tax=Trematosphaeria pertusa TaxID=390896 RepID=A0A6A6IIH3_9PLEO|nr:uncharacterized protein BU26DRAFT_297198 [Trematosphaeria pertusa]KAF2250211.1 hypothetical protein BU26DRAFT_297198 [Trematosphaeria pertusa]
MPMIPRVLPVPASLARWKQPWDNLRDSTAAREREGKAWLAVLSARWTQHQVSDADAASQRTTPEPSQTRYLPAISTSFRSDKIMDPVCVSSVIINRKGQNAPRNQ